MRPRRRSPVLPKLTRDAAIFLGGFAGLLHETLVVKAERPTLIAAFVAMIGLPAFLRSDEKKPPQ